MKSKRVFVSIMLVTALVVQVFAQKSKSMEEESLKLFLYSEKEFEKVSAYIEQQYGECEGVLHEFASADINCDIVIVPPTDEQPFYKLVTEGAGAYKMKIPFSARSQASNNRAEYVVFLPKDWNLKSGKEEDYWPIRMLKTVSRLPIWTEDWLGSGHSVNLTEDGNPVAEDTKFNSCVLLDSKGKDNQIVEPLKLNFFGSKRVAFYQLYPLYQEELEYKLKISYKELLEKVGAENINNLIVDIHRKSFCE